MEKEDNKKLEELEKLRELSFKKYNISLSLDSYEDIFSDFDPRPFSEKALSVDFLEEAERASRDKVSGAIELNLLVPKNKRSSSKEKVIRRRLRDHFKKHLEMLKKEKMEIIRRGIIFFVFGIIFMFLGAYIHFSWEDSIFTSFLIVILEPAGWFSFWEGLRQIIFDSKQINPKLEFYKKMHECVINFNSY